MDPVIPFDLQRMLLGDAPPLFLAEIAVRTAVIWLWAVLLLRWIGGRSISQMSVIEFLLVIALGSAVGDPMFYPDVPLLHGMVVILLVVLADKGIDLAFRRWSRVKSLVDGVPTEVLRHGQVLPGILAVRDIGTTELMELLRLKGVRNLGEVELAYLEPSGDLSVFRWDPPRPGLAIVPPPELGNPLPPRTGQPACCCTCGLVATTPPKACPHCGGRTWTEAAIVPDDFGTKGALAG